MPDRQDKGPFVAAQRALDACNRARGPFHDRQTALIFLMASLQTDWNAQRMRDARENPSAEPLPDFDVLCRAAARIANGEFSA